MGKQRVAALGAEKDVCAALATQPVKIIFTRGPQKRIMSWMCPPIPMPAGD